MRPTPAHLELAPPQEPGAGRAMGLSLGAHLLLALALAWGVRWTQSNPQVAFSAELWSPTVQEAAPAAAEPPPPPPQAPEARPAPPPPPAAREPEQPKADIAIEKKRKEEERKKAEALKAKAEKERAEKEKAEREKAERDKLAREKARKEEEARKTKEREQAKAKEQARKDAAAAEAAQDKLRQEQMRRIQGMAGATGAPDARGSAQRSAAPSSSYAGKIVEAIKNNTTFTDPAAGRPSVVVLVKTSPTGQILGARVVSPSGNKAWDDAVLRAVDKMGSVPRDVDGRIPEVLLREGLEIKVTL